MKRTQQTQEMVNITNNILRNTRVIDCTDDKFSFMQYLLLSTKTYRGFNWFYDKEINGQTVSALTGTSDLDKLKEMDAYIQLY